MEGWIKLHRKLLEWEWFDEPNTLSVFIYLLLSARHNIGSWRGIEIGVGQIITSKGKIAEATGLSAQEVRTTLARLEGTHEIEIQATNKYSIITICNYASYQADEDSVQQTTQQTTQQTNNKQITNKQQTNNNKQELYNYNNIEKERSLFKETNTPKGDISKESRFRKPTIEEIDCYCKERNNGINPQQFYDFYESKGWKIGSSKMKDWKAAIRTWEAKQLTPKKSEVGLFDNPKQSERARLEAELAQMAERNQALRQEQEEREAEEARNREMERIMNIIGK